MGDPRRRAAGVHRLITGPRLFRKPYASKWFYLLLFVLVVVFYGHYKYRQFVFLPDEDRAYIVMDFTLGEEGNKPFYQTDDDLRLIGELNGMKEGRAFSYVAKKYYDLYKKHYAGARVLTQCVRINERQYPEIYAMVTDACNVLQLNPPRVFVRSATGTQMFVTNYQNPAIIVSGDFLWAFTPEELRFLLARQVGHIKCNHVFFLDMIKGAQSIVRAAVPDFVSKFVIGGLGIRLMNWYKEAEITADRAGLVVTGDVEVATNALVKLNIGASVEQYYGGVNAQEYTTQLEGFEAGRITSASAAINELRNPNPFVTIRVRDLLKWYEANRYVFK